LSFTDFGKVNKKCTLFSDRAQRFGTSPKPPLPGEEVGIARNVRDGLWPLNGLRHPVAGETSGWRFLVAPDFEDVWFDESLLNV
jgi:hypothetical protein